MPFPGISRILPAGEVLRFGLVGIAATLTHLGVLSLGVEVAGLPATPMNGLAFCVAVAVTYLGQSRWVFRADRGSPALLARFGISVLTGLLCNLLIMALAVQVLRLHYLVGFGSALVLVPAFTFLLNKFWVFRKHDVLQPRSD